MPCALVTGASSGIGRALAITLAARGYDVTVAARRDGALRALASEIEGHGGRARVLPLDVADTEGTVRTVRELDEELGLDLVIANAGVGPALDALPYSWEALAGPCHVNFCGAAATLTAALPRMVERGRGHLVGISSLASFGALPGSAAYCAPKAGLSMLLDCLRMDVARHGVAVTTVHAGFVQTPMVAHRHAAMPQLVSAHEAAKLIADALPRRPAHIDFPQPLAVAARLAAHLPRSIREVLLSKERLK